MISLTTPAHPVRGVPHIIEGIGGAVFPTAEHPESAVVRDPGKVVASSPIGLSNQWRPIAAIRTAPYVSHVLAAEDVEPALEDDDAGLVARRPGCGVRDLCPEVPSSDTQTSFKKPSVE
jgi:hypothetical protein